MIDHLMILRKNRWFAVDTRVLHARDYPARARRLRGGGQAWCWGEYTDHEPVELTCREARDWRRSEEPSGRAPRPAWASLRGPTEEAKRRRVAFEELTDNAVAQAGDEVSWEELVAI